MAKISAVLTLTVLLAVSVCFGQSVNSEKKLIPVKPAYSDPVPEPQPQAQIDPYAPVPPRPRDQLYVFWILGKLISYPIDKAESYISSIVFQRKREGSAVPASAGSEANPFNSVNWREIPPAPPVSNAPTGR